MALIRARQAGAGVDLAAKTTRVSSSPDKGNVVITEDDFYEIKPPKIGGAALKCPDCGAFMGLIKIDGRVRLEFDAPGGLAFAQVLLSVVPEAIKHDHDAAFAFGLRAYSLLSLITAGNETAIDRYLDNPKLVEALVALVKELNATPNHDHKSLNDE